MNRHRLPGVPGRMESLLVAVVAANLLSCNATTTGKEITLSVSVAGGTSANTPTTEPFTTYAGWSVTLSQALVAVGPLYFYEGAPQASLWRRAFSIPSAHACPTHAQYNKGTVLGEVLRQYVVNLLAPPMSLGSVLGLAGTCRTVELHLHPPGEVSQGASATEIELLEGKSVRLQGSASKAGVTVPFIARLTIPDEGLMRIVESIAAQVELADASQRPGALLIEPLLDMWLASVDFDSLTQMEGSSYVFSDDSQAWAALVRGVRSRNSYRVSWRTQ